MLKIFLRLFSHFTVNMLLGAIILTLLYNLSILLGLRWLLFPIDFLFVNSFVLLSNLFCIIPERDLISAGLLVGAMWCTYVGLVGTIAKWLFLYVCQCPCPEMFSSNECPLGENEGAEPESRRNPNLCDSELAEAWDIFTAEGGKGINNPK